MLVINATGGTFTLSNGSAETAPLDYNISAGNLETAVEGLGFADVDVSKSGSEYTITFLAPADTDVAKLIVDPSQLIPPNSTLKMDPHVSATNVEDALNGLPDIGVGGYTIEVTDRGDGNYRPRQLALNGKSCRR